MATMQLRSVASASTQLVFLDASQHVRVSGNVLILTNVATGAQKLVQGTGRGITAFAVCRHQQKIAYATRELEPCVHVLDAATAQPQASLRLSSPNGAAALALSHDARFLAVAFEAPDQMLRVYSISQGDVTLVADAELAKPVLEVVANPMDSSVFAARTLEAVYYYKLETIGSKSRLVERRLTMPGGSATCLAFYTEGLYVGTSSGHVFSFDHIGALHMLPASDSAEAEPDCIELVSDDGEVMPAAHLAVSKWDFVVVPQTSNRLLRCSHLRGQQAGQGHQEPVIVDFVDAFVFAAYGGDGWRDLFALATTGSLVRITPDGAASVASEAHTARITGVAAAPANDEVVSTSYDGSLRVWDASLMVCRMKRTFAAPLTALATLPDAAFVATGSDTGVLRVIRTTPNLTVVFRARVARTAISCISLSELNGAVAVACLAGNTISLSTFRTDGNVLVKPIPVHVSGGPLAVTLAACDNSNYLLISLRSAELACIAVPETLSNVTMANAAERRCKLNAPAYLLHVVPRTDTLGRLYALTADRQLSTHDLPTDVGAWTRARVLRSVDSIDTLGAANGAALSVLSANGNATGLIANSSASGFVALRSDAFGSKKAPVNTAHVGDCLECGLTALAFDPSGRHIVAGAADGALFAFGVDGTQGAAAACERQQVPQEAENVPDRDELDDEHEALVWEVAANAGARILRGTIVEELSAEQAAAAARFAMLRQRFESLLTRNNKADEREKLTRSAFAVDDDLIAQLKVEGDKRVAAIKARHERTNHEHAIVCRRVRESCWNAMDSKFRSITGVRFDRVVSCYPVKESPADQQRIAQVTFLRKVEELEWAATGRRSTAEARRVELDAEGRPKPKKRHDEDGAVIADDGTGAAADVAETSKPAAASPAVAKLAAVMYSDWDLCSPARRAINALLQQAVVHQLWLDFNRAFDEVFKRKVATVDKIAEQNNRLREIAGDMAHMGYKLKESEVAPLAVHSHPDEDFEATFAVSDADVACETYVSAAERERQAQEARAEAARTAEKAKDDIFGRALKQMMNGELASRDKEQEVWVLEKPDWMLQPAAGWTDEQKQLAAQFAAEQKRLDDEKEKRKAALEGEIRTIRSTLDDFARQIDSDVKKLQEMRYTSDKEGREYELRAVINSHQSETLAHLHGAAIALLSAELSPLQRQQNLLTNTLQQLREKVKTCQNTVDSVQQADRQLDRSLKKEFADAEDALPLLVSIAKQRAHVPTAAARRRQADGASADAFPEGYLRPDAGPVLARTPPAQQPPDVDTPTWHRFLRWYDQKIVSENNLTAAQADFTDLRNLLEYVLGEQTGVAARCVELQNAVSQVRKDMQSNLANLTAFLSLKHGQVEIGEPGMDASAAREAVMVDSSRVRTLNAFRRERCAACIRVLQEIRDFKVGIYKLEWECMRLDMESKDGLERIRELQLLRVTAELNFLFANPTKASRKSNLEVQKMEAQMQHNKLLHDKAVKERKHHLVSLRRGIEKKVHANTALQHQVVNLAALMDEQMPIMDTVAPGNPVEARMKNVVTTKKLRDIQKAQQQEIAAMKAELDRLHQRTFPSFVDMNIPLQPDEIAR